MLVSFCKQSKERGMQGHRDGWLPGSPSMPGHQLIVCGGMRVMELIHCQEASRIDALFYRHKGGKLLSEVAGETLIAVNFCTTTTHLHSVLLRYTH